MDSSRKIKIFDTTLRDGQQCPGAGMNFEENLAYAELAHQAGVDVLEAGFPSASKVDFEIVREIASLYGEKKSSPTVAGLCQLRMAQVEKTIDALQPVTQVGRSRMHVYLPVDPKLMEASLGKERAENKAALVVDLGEAVEKAVKAGLEVEFSPEGYSRMAGNFDFVTDLIAAAVGAGASVINCPDTIGGGCWLQGENYFVKNLSKHAAIIDEKFPGNEVTWSAHCHNDFGLALHNSLAAVFDGPCRQIEGCFNGVGERAGNVSLEQCIMVIKHFAACGNSKEPFYTDIETEKIAEVCAFVADRMLPSQPHWPVSGYNAARHSSGGHTNAVIKNPLAYQPFDPKEVGQEISMIFGPLSGGNHAKSIIESFGYRCEEDEKANVAQYIKDRFSDRRKGITDKELFEGYFDYRKPINVSGFDYSRSSNKSEIFLKGRFFEVDGDFSASSTGKDSALAALKKAIDQYYPGLKIQNYRSESSGEGISSTSVSTILLEDEKENVFEGQGEDQDLEIAAMKALINAANLAYVDTHYRIKKNG